MQGLVWARRHQKLIFPRDPAILSEPAALGHCLHIAMLRCALLLAKQTGNSAWVGLSAECTHKHALSHMHLACCF